MARVPGSSPASKKTSKVTKAASASSPKVASKAVKVTKPKPSGSRGPSPTVVKQESLQVKIPHTEEGRLFLAKLHELLKTSDLPFKQVCPPTQSKSKTDLKASEGDGTTYALEMRLEQEGWPPF